MAWVILVLAAGFEVVWASSMKASEGFTRPIWVVSTVAAAAISFWLLAHAMKSIPLGSAYAVWTGLGAVGAFVVGVIAFKEPLTAGRLASALLVLAGIVGFWLTSSDNPST
ncbi:MAG: multidrug efflux SMR transporter [Pseudomonadota bacterium]